MQNNGASAWCQLSIMSSAENSKGTFLAGGNISQPDYQVRNECEHITTKKAMIDISIEFHGDQGSSTSNSMGFSTGI